MNSLLIAGGIAFLFILLLAGATLFIRSIFILDPFSIRKRLEAGKTAQMNLSVKLMETQKALEEKNRVLNHLGSQIKKANNDLARLNDLKTKFFQIVTHKIRNPLGIITGYSELLNQGETESLSQDQKKSVSSILNASKRANVLLKDLTDMVAIETGKFVVRVEPMEISDILKNAMPALEFAALQKNLKLQISLENNLPLALIDSDRVTQVLVNLVTNAAKFTEPGGNITIRAHKAAPPQPAVIIEVQDTGIGFDPSEGKKIFEKFYQSENQDRYTKEKGFGLGLFIVSEIMKAHDGQVWAESKGLGKGAKFSISLKVVES